MGLESYQARYTYQLTDWTKRAYDKRGVKYEIIPGETIDDSEAIVTGQVLDAHGRSYYSLSQTMNLVQKMKNGEITSDDVIFYEDMYTPGLECLPYIMDQSPPTNMKTHYQSISITINQHSSSSIIYSHSSIAIDSGCYRSIY